MILIRNKPRSFSLQTIGVAEKEIAKINKRLDKGKQVVESKTKKEEDQQDFRNTLLKDQLNHLQGLLSD